MVGPRLDGRGGVASVVRTWRDFGLLERWQVLYVATNGSGGLARKALFALSAWRKCAFAILGRRVELVHVHTSSYASFWRKSPVFALAMATGRPFVVSLHGGAFRDFYANRGTLGKAWMRLVMRRAACFVVLTNTWKRWVESIEPRSKIMVIPNPVPELPDLNAFATASQEAVCADAPATLLLLFLGRIEEEKGIFVLLEALAEAKRSGAAWQLVCGGTGDIELAQQRAIAFGLSDEEVRFVGWVDGDAKRDWLQRCQMLVLPSFTENMPLVLLEAFAYGKPVAATSVGGIPDMVVEGEDGFLFPPGDPSSLATILLAAAQPSTDLRRMGAAAREKAASCYAPSDVISKVEALYRKLLVSMGL